MPSGGGGKVRGLRLGHALRERAASADMTAFETMDKREKKKKSLGRGRRTLVVIYLSPASLSACPPPLVTIVSNRVNC